MLIHRSRLPRVEISAVGCYTDPFMITEGNLSGRVDKVLTAARTINDILDRLTYDGDIQSTLATGNWIDRRTARGFIQPLFDSLPPAVTHLDLGDDVVVERERNGLRRISEDDRQVWDLEAVDFHLAQE